MMLSMQLLTICVSLLSVSYGQLFTPGTYNVNDNSGYGGTVLADADGFFFINCIAPGGCVTDGHELVLLGGTFFVDCGPEGSKFCKNVEVTIHRISDVPSVTIFGDMSNILLRSANEGDARQGFYIINATDLNSFSNTTIHSSNDNFEIRCTGPSSCNNIHIEERYLGPSTNFLTLRCVGDNACSGNYTQDNINQMNITCEGSNSCNNMRIFFTDNATSTFSGCNTPGSCNNIRIYSLSGLGVGVNANIGSNANGVLIYCGEGYTEVCTLNTAGECNEGTVLCDGSTHPPSNNPSGNPSISPTSQPSDSPTPEPSISPTQSPVPSVSPTSNPLIDGYNIEILNDPMNNFNNWPILAPGSGDTTFTSDSSNCNGDPPCAEISLDAFGTSAEPYIETIQNTLGLTNICIEYSTRTAELSNSEHAGIYYSCNGGQSYNTRVQWTNNGAHYSDNEFNPSFFYITNPNCFRSNFRVRLAGNFDMNGFYGEGYFYINDLKILGNCGDTPEPSLSPTDSPSSNPSTSPTVTPSNNPTDRPTNNPSVNPSVSPTVTPSKSPTETPTGNPSNRPTENPSINPSVSPTVTPSKSPTDSPTRNPIESPTVNPTVSPSRSPISFPTENPTMTPTGDPTTENPTIDPTMSPSVSPSKLPSPMPTDRPSVNPSMTPSDSPTMSPTTEDPTLNPTDTVTTAAPTNIETTSLAPTPQTTSDVTTMTPTSAPTGFSFTVHFGFAGQSFGSAMSDAMITVGNVIEDTIEDGNDIDVGVNVISFTNNRRRLQTTENYDVEANVITNADDYDTALNTASSSNFSTALEDGLIAAFNDTSISMTSGVTVTETAGLCNYTTGDLTVDWDTEFMSTTSSVQSSISSYQNINDDGNLEIIVMVTADYIVDGIYQDDTTVGATYVIDTQEFTGERLLGNPNTCENRYEDDFMNLTFSDYWSYTLDPESGTFPGYMGMGMEYPISDWDLVSNVNDDSCSVTWTRTFSFEQLYYDCGFDLSETDDEISLSGVFYLALVSPSGLFYPLNSLTDTGEYFVKQLEAHSVSITFDKSYTLKTLSESVNLFGAQIVAAHYDPQTNLFTLQIYTYVPNYLQVNYVTDFVPSSNGTYGNSTIFEDDYDGECLLRDDYRCWQKFILTVPDDECERDSFNDIFNILGWLLCYDDNDYNDTDSNCYTFLSNRNEFENFYSYIGSVELNYALSCNEAVYQQDFSSGGLLAFATDSTYDEQNTDPVYSAGDTAYMGFEIENNLNGYNLITTEIISGSLCTSDDSSITSCSDDSVNIYDLYDIMSDSTINYQLLNVYTDEFRTEFSLVIPVISQDYICVEILVELTLIDNGGDIRRVLLSSSGEFSSFSNFGASAKILNPDNIEIKPNGNGNDNKSFNNYIYITAGIAMLIIISIAVITFIVVRKYKKNSMKYEEVVEMQVQNIKDEFEGLVE